jgi:tRNA(adenine34) deaminase
MVSRWSQLNEPWRVAFEQAIAAYLGQNSAPIGAAIIDGRGEVVSRGANAFASSRLAHAELNSLVALPSNTDRTACEIYSTLEPCPMCVGAIRMSQLRGVHFAARDPSAGFTDLLSANEFMREFPCAVHRPQDPDLEAVIVSLVLEFRLRTGHTRWLDHWRAYHPVAANCGLCLFESSAHSNWVARAATAESIYDQVLSMRGTT